MTIFDISVTLHVLSLTHDRLTAYATKYLSLCYMHCGGFVLDVVA